MEKEIILSIIVYMKHKATSEISETERFFDALENTYDNDKYEIIAVDNNSTCEGEKELREKLVKRGIVVMKHNEDYEPKEALSKAIDICPGKYIFILEACTFVPAGWIEKALDFFANNPKNQFIHTTYNEKTVYGLRKEN